MTLHGDQLEPHTNFQVDPSCRPVSRVVTGGAADRLHFSDGSMAVKFPPQIISADISKAARPLPLRDGTPSTIAQRTMRRPATSLCDVVPGTLEVHNLTDFHLNGRIPGQRTMSAGDHSYATLRDPGSWEKSVEVGCCNLFPAAIACLSILSLSSLPLYPFSLFTPSLSPLSRHSLSFL